MTTRVRATEFTELGLGDWRVLRTGIEANFHCGSFGAAAAFVAAVAELCDAQDHHAAIDLRYPDLVHLRSSTHYLDDLTDRDVTLARAVSRLAESRGARSAPRDSTLLEIAVDALDIDAVRPFWQAVLGYDAGHAPEGKSARSVRDPRGVGPELWFQQMDAPRPQRNRVHVDVVVPHDVAEERLRAALAAGGRLVDDTSAKAFWVLADAEGNEACICTWEDRGN